MAGPFLRLAVVGDPVDHSRSPELHEGFLASAGLAGSYGRIRIAASEGSRGFARLRAEGYVGLNVTTPLKEEAFAFAVRHDAVARATGSVNTLLFGGDVGGYNTDGIGVLGVLADAGLPSPAGAHVLVLGAGPTARTAVAALRASQAEVWVWNRSPARNAPALELGARSFERGLALDAIFAALAPQAMPEDDAVRNAILATPIFVDANYAERATLARALGRPGFDGARMLEHSARASFEIWRAFVAG